MSPSNTSSTAKLKRAVPPRAAWAASWIGLAVFVAGLISGRWVPALAFVMILTGILLSAIAIAALVWWKSRTTRRLLLGRCAVCNYDLCGEFESGCPECGWNRPEGDA